MLHNKRHTRIAIFIDYDNFTSSYRTKFNKGIKERLTVWDTLTHRLLSYYNDHFLNSEVEVMDHIGTYLCVGMSDSPYPEEKEIKKQFQAIDRKPGFIVRYGHRSQGYRDKKTGDFKMGKEKGVDAEIICQMLMGAFCNHYDSCILMSDDNDYLPAVRRVQEYFGRKVIQAGFHDGKLRNQSFAHIPLELADSRLEFGGELVEGSIDKIGQDQ